MQDILYLHFKRHLESTSYFQIRDLRLILLGPVGDGLQQKFGFYITKETFKNIILLFCWKQGRATTGYFWNLTQVFTWIDSLFSFFG